MKVVKKNISKEKLNLKIHVKRHHNIISKVKFISYTQPIPYPMPPFDWTFSVRFSESDIDATKTST